MSEKLEKSEISIENKFDYENLVLEGGGIKGLAYCGALIALEKKNILEKIKRFAGSSAGAITATLIAIGYNTDEISNITKNTDFKSFLDDKTGLIRDLYNFFTKYGICQGDTFSNLMKALIKNKTGNEKYTFNNLYTDTGKELVITGTNLTNMTTIYYSREKYPDMAIYKAVRISMSIPFLFVPILHDNKYMVDGGVIDNYPIHVFDGEYPGDPNSLMKLTEPNLKTIGLKLMTPNETTNYELDDTVNNIDSIKKFAMSLANTLMLSNEQKYINPINWKRTIPIKVPNYPLTKFNLDKNEEENLINMGIEAVEKYFK